MSEEIKLMKIDYALLQNKFIECNSEKMVLQQENSQLKQKLAILSVKPSIPTTEEKLKYRIEKAIEYIESNSYFKDNVVKTMIFKDYSNDLLEILKGDKE